MNAASELIQEVEAIYRWVDTEAAEWGSSCRACGACCDFETFGHRLYVTTPELLYFHHHAGPQIKPMAGGVCPYRIEGKCSVYAYRFAGCRIFTCRGDSDGENRLSEAAIRQFKRLCDIHRQPYHYVPLRRGLTAGWDFRAAERFGS